MTRPWERSWDPRTPRDPNHVHQRLAETKKMLQRDDGTEGQRKRWCLFFQISDVNSTILQPRISNACAELVDEVVTHGVQLKLHTSLVH